MVLIFLPDNVALNYARNNQSIAREIKSPAFGVTRRMSSIYQTRLEFRLYTVAISLKSELLIPCFNAATASFFWLLLSLYFVARWAADLVSRSFLPAQAVLAAMREGFLNPCLLLLKLSYQQRAVLNSISSTRDYQQDYFITPSESGSIFSRRSIKMFVSLEQVPRHFLINSTSAWEAQ